MENNPRLVPDYADTGHAELFRFVLPLKADPCAKDAALNLLTSHSALSLPLLADVMVDPEKLKQVSRVDRLGNLAPKNITVSDFLPRLASHLATTASPACPQTQNLEWELCAEIRTLITQRHQILVALVNLKYLPALMAYFGDDAARPESGTLLQVIGPRVTPSNIPTVQSMPATKARLLFPHDELEESHVPVALNPSAWCQSWCRGTEQQKELLRLAFSGVDSATISTKNYAALRSIAARLIPSSKPYRMLRSPKFWAYAIVFLYSSLRALPVVLVKSFHGSLLLLWLMDVLTAVPYTWGLITFVTAHQAWKRYTGLVVTLSTFLAPYIYFWTHGNHYPIHIHVIITTMITAAFGWEARNFLRDKAVSAGLKRRLFS